MAKLTDPRRSAHADVLVRARAIHPFDGGEAVFSALAVRDGRVLALATGADELDDLAGPETSVVDARDLVVLPGFYDTHVHQLEGALELTTVQVGGARRIDDLVAAVAARAEATPEGEWIVTSRGWHESALAEKRLPTARELDAATTRHPVCVRRGSHLVVGNTLALERAGLDPGVGPLDGDEAIAPVVALLPEPSFEERVRALADMCAAYNARGIVAVRDPGLPREAFRVYQGLWERGGLSVRTVVMLRLDEGWPLERMLAEIDAWGVRTGFGDDVLRVGGVKLFVDGRIEDGAMSAPYSHDPSSHGQLYLDADDLARAVAHAVDGGWHVGCHAVGDVAVAAVLDAYERVLAARPALDPSTLVVEHALHAPGDLPRRIAALGVGVSVHHAIVYAFASDILRCWGPERAQVASPVRSLLDAGALVAAGSDGNVPPFDPLLGIWGLVTRGTEVEGVLGAEQAVGRHEAVELYTVAGARLLGEERRGPLTPGRLADLVAFPTDPLTCPVDDLPTLAPVFTLVGGRPVHDREGRFA